MNSKKIFKRTLPIMIALLIVIVVAFISTVATFNKSVPTFSSTEYANSDYITYTKGDVTVKISRKEVYDALKGSSNSMTTAVSEMTEIIDRDLLKDYLASANEQDVYEAVAKAIFGTTFDNYVKNNKSSFEAAALKENKNYVDYLKEQINERISEFVKSQNNEAALKTSVDEFIYIDSNTNQFYYVQENGTDKLDEDGEKIYELRVAKTSKTYEYYLLSVARRNFAFDKLKADYKEELTKYIKYLEDSEEYKKYTTAVSRYEEELNIWKNSPKSTRGTKPVKPNKKDYKVTKAVEEVSAPVLVESNFTTLYENENYNKYNVIVIPYASEEEAVQALKQMNIDIKMNASSVYTWMRNDVALTEAEIKQTIIDLYNQFYQAYPEKVLNVGTDYTANGGVYLFTEAGLKKIEKTQSELSTLGVYSKAQENRFNKFDNNAVNALIDIYSNEIVKGNSTANIYLIVKKTTVTDWDTYFEVYVSIYFCSNVVS